MLLNRQAIKKWHLLTFLTLFLLAVVVFGVVVARPAAMTPGTPVIITVEPGMTAQEIGELLYVRGLIKNVLVFRVVAKIEGLENSLQAGEYQITSDMPVQKIVGMLARGETVYRLLIIPEGYTVNQIAELIESNKLGSAAKFKALAKNYAPYSYMETNRPVIYKAEGFLFPDTYRVSAGITEEQLLAMLVAQFDKQLTAEMRDKINQRGLTLRETIILASLVEKEARVDTDRPLIAGAFLNRLKKDMPLQSCATIQYILGVPKPELTIKDTEIPSPYNTYQNLGLPPGPVANPGMAAIRAVLDPAETNFLYFVADKNGAHIFSETYEQHLAAIERVR
ncbi:MAG: endolytic transglycosylase MltG [Negativicutes bacterium]|nr:endolytic transglycosylase MltG [Negativicutes bacterium]